MKKQASDKTAYMCFQEYVAEKPEGIFLFDEEKSLSGAQAFSAVKGLANRFYGMGICEGTYVALRSARSVNTAVIFLALQIIGAVAVMADPHVAVRQYISESGVGMNPGFYITNEEASMDPSYGEGWTVIDETAGTSTPLAVGEIASEDVCFPPLADSKKASIIVFTSGSTGKSKAVMLSQYAFINNVHLSCDRAGITKDDSMILILPLHHVFAVSVVFNTLYTHSALFIPEKAGLDDLMDGISRYGITLIVGVPTLFLAMAAKNAQKPIPTLRIGYIGGAPCSIEQFRRIETGLNMKMCTVYGMSEFVSITFVDHRLPMEVRAIGVGAPSDLNEVAVRDDDGNLLRQGETGEIGVRGPSRMNGYFGEEPSDPSEYFFTGDLGFLDEQGILHICGRKKDIIIRNGTNISTAKIENAITELQDVSSAAVVGMPHAKLGEIPCAMVVMQKSGEDISEEQLLHSLSKTLAKNELPYLICMTDSIPLTSTGKADKQKIKEYFAARLKEKGE